MQYIASCSFGKDSIATVLLALEKGEPLDAVLFCEVMFDHERGISGEIPEHIEWVYKKAIPTFTRLNVPTIVVRAETDYVTLFNKVRVKGKYVGKRNGWPIGGRCIINSSYKAQVIRKYLKTLGDDYTQYIGIAIDEPKRLQRLKGNNISLLAKYGYTEQMAMDLCRKYDLVSPIYETGTRGGCWFCPNNPIPVFARLKEKHPELWRELETLSRADNLCGEGFKWELTFDEVNRKIDNHLKKQAAQLTLFNK